MGRLHSHLLTSEVALLLGVPDLGGIPVDGRVLRSFGCPRRTYAHAVAVPRAACGHHVRQAAKERGTCRVGEQGCQLSWLALPADVQLQGWTDEEDVNSPLTTAAPGSSGSNRCTPAGSMARTRDCRKGERPKPPASSTCAREVAGVTGSSPVPLTLAPSLPPSPCCTCCRCPCPPRAGPSSGP
jgi:hypothetical protein